MRRIAVVGTLGIVLVATGVLAATGLGDGGEKAAVAGGQPVEKKVERISAAQARAHGAAPVARAKAKKVRISYFLASTPTVVPANTATAISVLTCPAGKAIAGFYQTDRLIAADYFSAGANVISWEYGFVDLSGVNGIASEGIVCAKGVK